MRQWLIGAVGLAVLVAAGPERATGEGQPAYVGTAVCISCHIDFARQWAALDHGKAMSVEGQPPEKTGCEACHGPGGAHVAGQRKQIRKWQPLEISERNGICLQCHEDKLNAEQWEVSIHSVLLSCDQCHEVHHATDEASMLRQDENATCLACHDTLTQDAVAGHHHTLLDGALTCSQCHSFHGSAEASLLVQPQDELCANCHGDEVPRPESHEREDFRLGHKAEATADQQACLTCHSQEAFCKQCHAVAIPHAENYALEHTDEAKKQLAPCLQCHQTDYCAVCHDPVPQPPAAPGEDRKQDEP